MYNFLKSAVIKILPKNFLVKNEILLRKILSPVYRGNNFECNICKTKLKKFVSLKNQEQICPACGSLPRVRRLYHLLESEYLKKDSSILDFSPARVIYRKLKKRTDLNYFATDFENEFLADHQFDITNIEIEDDTFNLIICYHILEHINADEAAMRELYRVAKKDAVVLIQTPFKSGEIYEDYSKTSAEERLKYFGQEDHIRIYSASGLEYRLQRAGFSTEIKILKEDKYYGFAKDETVIVCIK